MKAAKISFYGIISIITAMIFISGCNKSSDPIVARVGGRTITASEFERRFGQGRKTDEVRSATLEVKKEYLNKLIDEKLKIVSAYQSKLNEDDKITQLVNDRRKAQMFRRLIDLEVVEKIIPESRIKEYYQNSSKEVRIRQIVLKWDRLVAESKSDAFHRAKRLVQKLKMGESFAELAKTHSEDSETAKNGGNVGYLKWSPSAVQNPVFTAAFSMKQDETSQPIETDDGYYIIKVIHIKNYPSPPYEQEKEKIRQLIYRLHAEEIEQAYGQYLEDLKRKYRLKFNKDNIQHFVSRLNAPVDEKITLQEDIQAAKKTEKSVFDKFSTQDRARIVAELSFRSVNIGDVIAQINLLPRHRRPRFRTSEDFNQYLNQRIITLMILDHVLDAKKIEKDPIVVEQINSYEQSLLMRTIYQKQVKEQLTISEEDLLTYFEENREKYKHPPTREAKEIFVTDKSLAEKIVARARAGENFDLLFRQYNEKKSLEQDQGYLGFMSRGRAGFGKPVFETNVGGVTDPVRIGNGYSILKVLSEKPETLKTFEEAEKLVASRLNRERAAEREKQWLQELRKKIPVVIYDNHLEKTGKKFVGSDVIFVD